MRHRPEASNTVISERGASSPVPGRACEKRIDLAYVGPEAGVSLIVGTTEAPTRPDASPEPLTIPHTGRDLVSRAIPKRILAVGFGRW